MGIAHIDRSNTGSITARVDRQLFDSAENAMRGLLILHGTDGQPGFVGNPPDWFATPAGDREYTWTLNRLEHWVTLLRAWQLAGDRRYADRVVFELRDWLARCQCPPIDPSQVGQKFHDGTRIGFVRGLGPWLRRHPSLYRATSTLRRMSRNAPDKILVVRPPLGSTPANSLPWRTLEAGIRMVHVWPLLRQHLSELAPGDERLSEQLNASAAVHGRVLATLSPLLWPDADHNHYLMECLGLLAVGSCFTDLPESKRWISQAMSELERCTRAQFTADGGHIEGCPHYHNVCVYLLARAVLIARRAGLKFSDTVHQTLARALNHCVQVLRPDGTGVPAGDSDADALAVQATLMGFLANGDDRPLRAVVALSGEDSLLHYLGLHAECVDDPKDILRRCRLSTRTTLPLTAWQRQLGQATLRTGWTRDAISIFFSCRTPVHNGHAHADPASFDLTAGGVPLLIDPGRLTYMNNSDRRAIKSAAWHNSLTVDDREPFEYLSSMHFGPQREGNIISVIEQPGFLAAVARHHNYHPVVHQRLVAIIDNRFLLVLDKLDGLRPRSCVQLRYHLNGSDFSWNTRRTGVCGIVGDVKIHLLTSAGLTGCDQPAKVSTRMGQFNQSVVLKFEDQPGDTGRCHATILYPIRSGLPHPRLQAPVVTINKTSVDCALEVEGMTFRINWPAAENGLPSMTMADGVRPKQLVGVRIPASR